MFVYKKQLKKNMSYLCTVNYTCICFFYCLHKERSLNLLQIIMHQKSFHVFEVCIPPQGIGKSITQTVLKIHIISLIAIHFLNQTPTLVVNLKPRLSRKFSRVSHHAVVFGAVFTNNSWTKSKRLMSTAKVGSFGAQGKSPRLSSSRGTLEQVQSIHFSIPGCQC